VTALKLTDEQLDIVMAACQPLQPHQRDAFLREVAAQLSAAGELGPGLVARVCATVQRQYFDAPLEVADGRGRWAKYR